MASMCVVGMHGTFVPSDMARLVGDSCVACLGFPFFDLPHLPPLYFLLVAFGDRPRLRCCDFPHPGMALLMASLSQTL